MNNKKKISKIKWGEDPEFSGPKDWFRNGMIIKEVKNLKSRGAVLDFGCGSGNLLIRLGNLGFSCLGIDASSLCVNYIRNKIKNTQLDDRIIAKKGDVNTLQKLEEKYDIIICGETLEHIRNDKKVIEELGKVLNKDGICIITVPAHQKYWDITDEIAGHYRRYSKEKIIDLFENSRLKIIKMHYWGFPIGRLWHKFFLHPFFKRKISRENIYTGSGRVFGKILASVFIKRLLSPPFYIDKLFDWTELGDGLILVAKKNEN